MQITRRYRDVAPKDVALVACILLAARGLVLVDTERAKDGEESLKKALALDRQPQRFAALLQQVLHPRRCRGGWSSCVCAPANPWARTGCVKASTCPRALRQLPASAWAVPAPPPGQSARSSPTSSQGVTAPQVNNSMAVARAQQDEPAEALPFLQRAEALYDEYLAEEHAPLLSPTEDEAPAEQLMRMRLEDNDSWWLQVGCLACGARKVADCPVGSTWCGQVSRTWSLGSCKASAA